MIRYNLGAGERPLDGYVNLDRKTGSEAFPLKNVADGTVDEVRASHLLEHFSHTVEAEVIREWVRVLKPGGVLKLAVPDFDRIVGEYKNLDGTDVPVEAYVMGGHCSQDDVHHSLWTEPKLRARMADAALIDIKPWTSEIQDCAALPVSLNLQGTKPSSQAPARPDFVWPRLAVVESVPRLGFMDNNKCLFEVFLGLPVTLHQVSGVFWGSCMTKGMDLAVNGGEAEFIVTVDYDTVFTRADLRALVELMRAHPEADAIFPLQSGRDRATPLITIRGPDGKFKSQAAAEDFSGDLVPVASGHFGLTIIRVSSLKGTPKPWFQGIVRDGLSADDDIYFWRQWEAMGKKFYLAPHIVVGHLELVVAWPGLNFKTTHQSVVEYREKGKPEGTWK